MPTCRVAAYWAWMFAVPVLGGCSKSDHRTPPRADASAVDGSPAAPTDFEIAAPPARSPIGGDDAIRAAREEFDLAPEAHATGTMKLYSRAVFLPLDDLDYTREGDFIGRLRTLFGIRPHDAYVLRHRATGFIVTAYFGKSGASYGGADKIDGPLSPRGRSPAGPIGGEAPEARNARLASDPVIVAKMPSQRIGTSSADEATLRARAISPTLREADHRWQRHLADVYAPPGFAAVVDRLDALVAGSRPSDWSAIRYWADDPGVYRVGARNGSAFSEQLSEDEGIEKLLDASERQPDNVPEAIEGGSIRGSHADVVDYWVYHAKRGKRVEAALPRVRRAWMRNALNLRIVYKDNPDAEAFALARRDAAILGIDPERANAALR